AFAQRLAFEELHSDEGAMVVLADFVDGAYVGVVEGGGGTGFALEALEGLAIVGEVVRQEFKCDKAAELGVLGFVNHTHAPASQFFDNAVVRNSLAYKGFGTRHSEAILGCVRKASQRTDDYCVKALLKCPLPYLD